MIYKDFKGKKISALALGTMRLPVLDGNDSNIDLAAAEEMFDYAIANGINYFDTAWGYHGGNSETAVGKCLSKYPRESYYLATKFPGYDLDNIDKAEGIFEAQLEKCRTDYFDFYLFHNVYEKNVDPYLDPKYNILGYLLEQKQRGRIKHLGFSVHGSIDVMKKFLGAYGDEMEFCQIQLNYIDWEFQQAKLKVELLNEKNIPIWVMEPLRGGRLAKLSDENMKLLRSLRSGETPVSFAFRYLQSIPGVTTVLSGMSSYEQLKQNISVFETEKPLNDKEIEALYSIARKTVQKDSLSCTACRYCVGHCPQGLDIPGLISLYNEHTFTGGGFIAPMAVEAMPEDKRPSACIGCKRCEAVCPQQLKIPKAMSDFSKMLGF